MMCQWELYLQKCIKYTGIVVIPDFLSACIFFCKITTTRKNKIISTTRATKHITNRTLTAYNPAVLVEELTTEV